MRCPVTEYARQTFREQVPGLVERYQRRTVRLGEQIRDVVCELAGRASARLLPSLGIAVGPDTAVRVLLGRAVSRVLGIDDFALRRCHDYATVVIDADTLIDADTGARIDVLAGRGAAVAAGWLRAHPGVEVVCRDGSAADAQAVRNAPPNTVQVADRWHLWHGLRDDVGTEGTAHSACWATATGTKLLNASCTDEQASTACATASSSSNTTTESAPEPITKQTPRQVVLVFSR